MEVNLERARGVLWGQAVGDALGATQEFAYPRKRQPFPQLNLGPQTDMVGGGPLGLYPGQTTDDTQMAACLAESLGEAGEFNAQDVARRYCAWMEFAFDVGNQTRASLTKIQQGLDPSEAGFVIWEATGRLAAGNGSLMRISPAAVFFADDEAALRQTALDDSAITHADPRCRLACAAFVAALRHALVCPSVEPESMRRAALEELASAANSLGSRTPRELGVQAVAALSKDLEWASRDDPGLESPEAHFYLQAGFVRVAFRLAFWELLHAPTFQACVLDCANRGGDADTNAAIAGALFGARVGEPGIPEAWRQSVWNCQPAKTGQQSHWNTKYHPRTLFRVLEKFEAKPRPDPAGRPLTPQG